MADDIITVSLVMVRLVLLVNRLAAASVADHPVSLHFEIPLFDGLHIISFFSLFRTKNLQRPLCRRLCQV